MDNNTIRHQIRQEGYTFAESLFSMAEDFWADDDVSFEAFLNEIIPAIKSYYMSMVREKQERMS